MNPSDALTTATTVTAAPDVAWPALAAIVLLTALATLAHWWLKHRGLLPTPTNAIKVVATRSLGSKRAVAIVEVEQQRFLLGLTDEAVSLLSQLPSEAKATSSGTVVSLLQGAGR